MTSKLKKNLKQRKLNNSNKVMYMYTGNRHVHHIYETGTMTNANT